MKIALASDHAGFELKMSVIRFLAGEGIPHRDFGCDSTESVDFVDFGARAVEEIVAGNFDRGILVCGTGLGMAIVANKFPGIQATPCWDEYSAEMSRQHNNSNCLTLGGRILSPEDAVSIVKVWLRTEFESGRHERRIAKIRKIEENILKACH